MASGQRGDVVLRCTKKPERSDGSSSAVLDY
jgi:hypothetical protein